MADDVMVEFALKKHLCYNKKGVEEKRDSPLYFDFLQCLRSFCDGLKIWTKSGGKNPLEPAELITRPVLLHINRYGSR